MNLLPGLEEIPYLAFFPDTVNLCNKARTLPPPTFPAFIVIEITVKAFEFLLRVTLGNEWYLQTH